MQKLCRAESSSLDLSLFVRFLFLKIVYRSSKHARACLCIDHTVNMNPYSESNTVLHGTGIQTKTGHVEDSISY